METSVVHDGTRNKDRDSALSSRSPLATLQVTALPAIGRFRAWLFIQVKSRWRAEAGDDFAVATTRKSTGW